jgi:hypothetical protein
MENFQDRVFLEVDGFIKSGISSGVGVLLGGLGSLFNSDGLNGGESYVQCRRWIRISRIEEIFFEDQEIVLSSPPRLRRAREDAEEAEQQQHAEITPSKAPNGWWVTLGAMRYHVFDTDAAKALTTMKNESEIAKSVMRLAEEIAYKPANQNGSVVNAANSHYLQTLCGDGE